LTAKHSDTLQFGVNDILCGKIFDSSPKACSRATTADSCLTYSAGTKMLAQITKTYFNDPGISQVDKTLFNFAAYNAGPDRIVRLRKEAADEGLDPNKWFGNVELVAAEDIGQETVQYVSNIFKYYVAYKMTIEQGQIRQQAKQQLAKN